MRTRISWMIALLVALVSVSSAQEKPLQLSARKEWEGARSSAPLSVRLFLKWKRPELLEGMVQVNAFVDQTRISALQSQETALSESEQILWFMTPRPILLDKYGRYVLETEFVSEKHALDPEQLDVDVPIRGKRVVVIGILSDNRSTTPTGLGSDISPTAFERPLLLQQFLDQVEVPELLVTLSRCPTNEFPSEPLRLLGLDALLMSHDMLNLLRTSQLEAIRTWVLSGGSLVLIRSGSLRAEATEFVDSLAQSEWSTPQKGRKRLPTDCFVYSPGLGQMIVVPHEIAGDSTGWNRIAYQMMRLKAGPITQLEGEGILHLRRDHLVNNRPVFSTSALEGATSLEPRARIDVERLTEQLMPESIQGMPFGVATSVLLACLFCIGPGDYFLLGLIRRRRWTWGIYPLVALGFTGWMAHLAAEHNGRNDSRNWIGVVDVSTENKILRTSRVELTYGASGRTVAHEVRNQWWTDLRQDDFVEARVVRDDLYQTWSPQSASSARRPAIVDQSERLRYVGSVPGDHIVEEPLRQWAPRLQRVTTLGADPELENYPLPQLSWSELPVDDVNDMSNYLREHLPSDWTSAHWRFRTLSSDTQWQPLTKDKLQESRVADILETTSRLLWEGPLKMNETSSHPGVFILFSELSPTAAPDCEDLVIGSRPTLVIANQVEPGRYVVLRVVFPAEAR